MKNLIPLTAILFFLVSSVYGNSDPVSSIRVGEYGFYAYLGPEQPERSIELFPNPVTEGRLTVTSSDNILSVQILNITGKVIFNQDYQPNTTTVEIELDKQEKGIYLVRINFANKEIHTEKIMIK
jgi:hypothetical protein